MGLGAGRPKTMGLGGWERPWHVGLEFGGPPHVHLGLFAALQGSGMGSNPGMGSPYRLRSRERRGKAGIKPQAFRVPP